MIDKLNLSQTSSRFCKLINRQKQVAEFLSYVAGICPSRPIMSFSFRSFARNFKVKFYERYVHKSDQIYLNYVLQIFIDLSREKVLAHMLWCTRNKFLNN